MSAPERPFASALRRAIFRGGLFAGVVFAGLMVLFLGLVSIEGSPPPGGLAWPLAGVAITSILLGITATPLSFLESLLARQARSPWRDRLGALAIAGAAFGLMVVASLQIVYTVAVLRTGSVESAATAVRGWVFQGLLDDPTLFTLFVVLAAPFAPVTLARVQELERGRAVARTLLYGSLLALPFFAVIWKQLHDNLRLLLGAGLLLVYALLPLVLELADAIERRVSERLERADA
jgi:hypothetical protein